MGENTNILSDIKMRTAGPSDAELLVELGKLAFYEAFSEETAPSDMADHLKTAFKVEDIKAQLNSDQSLFIIIEIDASAAGYAYLHPQTPPECVKGPNTIQLVRLYLRRKFYNRDVGNTLMKACLGEALSRGYRSVWLSSWELNHRANSFYKKWKFQIVGRAKFEVGSDIQKMIFTEVHRLFVYRKNPQNILGVLSLSDAARLRSGSCHACFSSRIKIDGHG